MNTPLMLTLLRILAIPFILIIYLLPFSWAHPAAAVLFAITAFTDWLDGYLARSLSQVTQLGAFLYPVADKLLIFLSFIIVLSSHLVPHLTIAAIIIVGREIAISALREWMSVIGKRAGVAVTWIAKFKTMIQMLALLLLVWYYPGASIWVKWVGAILLYVAAILTLWSMLIYLKVAWPDLTSARESQ